MAGRRALPRGRRGAWVSSARMVAIETCHATGTWRHAIEVRLTTGEQHARPGTASQLRTVRPRPAATIVRGAHLLKRMHLVRGVRRHRADERLPQLRWRARSQAHSADGGV